MTGSLQPFLLALLLTPAALHAAPHAVYRADQGVRQEEGRILAWESTPPGRPLDRVVGTPLWLEADAPSGTHVVRLDGRSALWAAVGAWGHLRRECTVIAYLRLHGDQQGFLFDGSTQSGLCRAQVREGHWQIGVQPGPIGNADRADRPTLPATHGTWQAHAFHYKPQADGSLQIEHQTGSRRAVAQVIPPANGLAGFILGANARTDRGLRCDVAEIQVHAHRLPSTEAEVVLDELTQRWGQPKVEEPATVPDPARYRTVVRTRDQDGVHTTRIPGLAAATNGLLLAVFDLRHQNGGDLPGDIDVGLRISTDEGRTWGPTQTILDYDAAVPGSRGNGVGDPAILVDRITGEILVSALWSQGNRGYHGSGPGMTPEQTGQWVITRSRDNGRTWSPPENITAQIKKPEWRLCFQGPGNGIQLRDGTLVFPAQFKDARNVPHACFIHSADHGRTWRIARAAIPGTPPTTEAAVAECADGSLLLTMRNEAKTGQRIWARWTWKGKLADGEWSEPWSDLADPTCMASLIRAADGRLLFCNPDHPSRRVKLTLRASADDGRTWDAGTVVDPGFAMYSCLVNLPDGDVGVLYESGSEAGLVFARLPAPPPAPRQAALRLDPPYGPHMVWPRDTEVPLRGVARPGTAVKVVFGEHAGNAVSDSQGVWSIPLPPQPASATPRALRVEAGEESLVLEDILVGEVWLCAGQSNMEWPVNKEAHASETLTAPPDPGLRLCNWNHAGQGFFSRPFGPAERARMQPDGFFQGEWKIDAPTARAGFSAVGYSAGARLRRELNVPVGLIHCAVGGSPTESWVRAATLRADPGLQSMVTGPWLDNSALDEWCRERGRQNLGEAIPDAAHPFRPGFLWNCGPARLTAFPLRGVLWYQGESNSLSDTRVRQHERLFPALVTDWRAQWCNPTLPFLICQLSGISTNGGYHAAFWPEFRWSQWRLADALGHSGCVVTHDHGHPTDVHPREKRAVGERLAALALATVYGKPQAWAGPLPERITREGGDLVLVFPRSVRSAGSDRSDRSPLFTCAGPDRRFAPVRAEIRDTVVRLRGAAPDAAWVRHAWQPHPTAWLADAAGLPVTTFELPVP